jgi:hypothetical protein
VFGTEVGAIRLSRHAPQCVERCNRRSKRIREFIGVAALACRRTANVLYAHAGMSLRTAELGCSPPHCPDGTPPRRPESPIDAFHDDPQSRLLFARRSRTTLQVRTQPFRDVSSAPDRRRSCAVISPTHRIAVGGIMRDKRIASVAHALDATVLKIARARAVAHYW